ncbi:unnamed protein product [marine sediment metagenome]|uniref:Uncharacterized protein n=1 Tax=marine sediment metagenome TaxID=412755 RepID=X1KB42_9ZZZZ
MNKTDLELIRNHITAIWKIIKEDPSGDSFFTRTLETFSNQIVNELQRIVWREYEYKKQEKKEES